MLIEREIKFTVSHRAIFDDIAAQTAIAGYRLHDLGLRHQEDTCFDTPDLRLYHGKAVLRLRRWEDHAVVTFKAHGGVHDGVYHRTEIESSVDVATIDSAAGRPPDCPAFDAFRAEFGEMELRRSLTVINDRRIFNLVRDGGTVYELVMDDVTFRGTGGETSVLELEIEARTPEDSDLPAIGADLAARFDLEPAGPSKYMLGMELVGGV